jgi:hypothetical protein
VNKLHTEDPNDLYSSSDNNKVLKLRIMRCTGHIAHMEAKRNACKFLWEHLKDREFLENLGVDGKLILK